MRNFQIPISLNESKYLTCNRCGKKVSTGFFPVETDTPDKGLIIRAWIECPECIEANSKSEESEFNERIRRYLVSVGLIEPAAEDE